MKAFRTRKWTGKDAYGEIHEKEITDSVKAAQCVVDGSRIPAPNLDDGSTDDEPEPVVSSKPVKGFLGVRQTELSRLWSTLLPDERLHYNSIAQEWTDDTAPLVIQQK